MNEEGKLIDQWVFHFLCTKGTDAYLDSLHKSYFHVPGTAPLWPSISTASKTYIDPHTVSIFLKFKRISMLYIFSMKIQQKQ